MWVSVWLLAVLWLQPAGSATARARAQRPSEPVFATATALVSVEPAMTASLVGRGTDRQSRAWNHSVSAGTD